MDGKGQNRKKSKQMTKNEEKPIPNKYDRVDTTDPSIGDANKTMLIKFIPSSDATSSADGETVQHNTLHFIWKPKKMLLWS